MRDVVDLSELRAGDAPVAGGKAANLGELIAAGLPVPPGCCVTLAAYDRVAGPVVRAAAPAEVRDAVGGLVLPDDLLAELAAAHEALGAAAVAVRSSAVAEDSAAASFAGQHHTELGVTSFDGVVRAVLRCWQSLWDPHAVAYRERTGTPHEAARMAVVVQAMADAEAAGVLFTVDPSRHRRGAEPGPDATMVIESSWGYGEAVVSGLVTPDHVEVARSDLRVVTTRIGSKQLRVAPAARSADGSDGGVAVVEAGAERDVASLTDEQARAVAELGLRVEAHFGAPQDVEWAIAGGRPVLLQARPLTTIGRDGADGGAGDGGAPDATWESPIDGAWWARLSICDSWLPDPLSPLFATSLFPRIVQQWMRNWAGDEAEQERNPLIPKPMTGTINGYAYLRFDYRLNRHPLHMLRLAANFYTFHLGPVERRWRRRVLPAHLAGVEELRHRDVATLDDDGVLAVLAEAQRLSAVYWAIIGGLAWYWNGAEWLTGRLYPWITAPLPPDETPSAASLSQGHRTRTYDCDVALHRLATTAEPDDVEAGLREVLDRYGHQVFNLDPAEPTPAEDPTAFRAAIDAYRAGSLDDPRRRLAALAERRDDAIRRLRTGLRRRPLRRLALAVLLRGGGRYARLRDEALFQFTLAWPLMRRGWLELGRRLVARGTLRTEADVFFLTESELLEALRGGPAAAATTADVAVARRAERERQRRLSPPHQVPEGVRLLMGPIDVTTSALLGRRATPAAEGGGVRGSAVSPGRVTGPVRLVTSADDFGSFRPGDVLVASYVTPAWSPLLAIAGGVVTDAGGALSHGSIVAREYGIPAVMGTGNATAVLRDGQVVTVDGDLGLVHGGG